MPFFSFDTYLYLVNFNILSVLVVNVYSKSADSIIGFQCTILYVALHNSRSSNSSTRYSHDNIAYLYNIHVHVKRPNR